MISQLLQTYNHIGTQTEKGNQLLSEVMTNFNLLSPKEKKEVCYQLLTYPNYTFEGGQIVDYLLTSSEYRKDFPKWAHDKGLFVRYESIRHKLDHMRQQSV